MGMLITRIDFQLLKHGATQWTQWQHTFDSGLDSTLWRLVNQLLKTDFLDATDVTCVVIVLFVFGFIACNTYFFCVDYNDIVASINMGSIFGLMLAAQPGG